MLRLLIFLLIRGVIIYFLIDLVPLSEEEAQYWTWSQDLAVGYYSKPPGVAWQIALTTSLFGNTVWGIRASALLIGSLTVLALYWTALRAKFSKNSSFLVAVTLGLIPAGVFGSFLAITDGGMLLFWTLALGYFVGTTRPNALVLGLLVAAGALFKWPIYLLWPIFFGWAFFHQRALISTLIWSALVSLVGLVPSFIWNLEHQFVTFRHVGATLQGGHYGSKGNIIEFFFAQAALLSPLIFIFCLYSIYRYFRVKESSREIQIIFWTTGFFIIPLIFSIFMKMQANWADFIYPSAILLTLYYLFQKSWGKSWLYASLALSLVCLALVFSLKIPYKTNPLKNTLGWSNLHETLERVEYDPDKEFLVGDTYQMASLLSFYGPEQKRAYFLNVTGKRLNQFSFWPGLGTDKREKGWVINQHAVDKGMKNPQDFLDLIDPYFESVSFVGSFPLYMEEGVSKRNADFYKVSKFKGKEPDVPESF